MGTTQPPRRRAAGPGCADKGSVVHKALSPCTLRKAASWRCGRAVGSDGALPPESPLQPWSPRQPPCGTLQVQAAQAEGSAYETIAGSGCPAAQCASSGMSSSERRRLWLPSAHERLRRELERSSSCPEDVLETRRSAPGGTGHVFLAGVLLELGSGCRP
jgi:hypothetical protein